MIYNKNCLLIDVTGNEFDSKMCLILVLVTIRRNLCNKIETCAKLHISRILFGSSFCTRGDQKVRGKMPLNRIAFIDCNDNSMKKRNWMCRKMSKCNVKCTSLRYKALP